MRIIHTSVLATLFICCCHVNAGPVLLSTDAELSQQTNAGVDVRSVDALPYQFAGGVNGGSGSSTGNYDLRTSSFDMLLQQQGSGTAFFGRSTGELSFSVTERTSYLMIDLFQSHGGSQWTAFIDLADLIAGESLYRSVQFNTSAPLGGVIPAGEDDGSGGSATGVLEPGREYRLRYVLYSMLSGTGGDAADFVNPGDGIGSSVIDGISAPRPRWLVSGGVDATIGVQFTPDSMIAPLPPVVWSGAAMLGVLATQQLNRHRRRRLAV